MTVIFEALQKNLRPILQETGLASPFEASVFRSISVYASALADEVVKHGTRNLAVAGFNAREEDLRRLDSRRESDESRQR
jgi:hypothetical protein